jgi:hypothetical protein
MRWIWLLLTQLGRSNLNRSRGWFQSFFRGSSDFTLEKLLLVEKYTLHVKS